MEEVLHGEGINGPLWIHIEHFGLPAPLVERLSAWSDAFMGQGPMWEWRSQKR